VREIRIGMVGAGFIARPHSEALARLAATYGPALPPVRRVAICDADGALAERAAARYGWERATADWREVTRADDVDAVLVLTPNDVHCAVAVDAAEHGKHVLCEKPLAAGVDAARTMRDAVTAAGVVHRVAFVYRHWPAMRLARELVADGSVGRVLRLRAHFFHDYALDPLLPASWRFDLGRAGAGAIGDLGSHVLDLACWLVGDVERVMARSRTVIGERPGAEGGAYAPVDVDDATDLWLELAGGAAGSAEVSWLAAGYKTDLAFEVQGDEGAVRFSWTRANELQVAGHDGTRTVPLGPDHPGAEHFWPVAGVGLGWADAFVLAAHDFVAAIAGEHGDGPDFDAGVRVAEIVAAAQASAATGAWTASNAPDASDRVTASHTSAQR
jgi:predicted dehydrogenase